jgi:hypothetical protein
VIRSGDRAAVNYRELTGDDAFVWDNQQGSPGLKDNAASEKTT